MRATAQRTGVIRTAAPTGSHQPVPKFPIAHGGVIAAPPPGSGSTAVGIVCRLRLRTAFIAGGNCLVSRGFLSESPLTSSPVCRAAGIAFSPMPWVCADLPARPRNSGARRHQLAGQAPRDEANRFPRMNNPSHKQPYGGESGSQAAQVVPGSAHV
jgi:hypothetical protein